MTALAALPTRKLEDWRYADIDALARVWPPAHGPERISVRAGDAQRMVITGLEAKDGVALREIEIMLLPGARFSLFALVHGAAYARLSVTVELMEGAHFELGAVILGSGDQTLEIVSDVHHAAPDATSNQVVRSVLAGTATGSALNRVRVARDAQHTDAQQSIRAMLLDRGASANAKPELEILADDVKCAHGATVGELDRQALFYLAARGLPPQEARRLMLQAFIADAFVAGESHLEGHGDVAQVEQAALAALGALL